MIEQSLEKLGFSPSEIKVYLQLLKGCSYANKLSAETGINRTNVYEALDRLIGKGVVSLITKNKVRWYDAKDANSLNSMIDERQGELAKLKADIAADIKDIAVNEEKQEATIFTGKKGLRMLFDEMIEVGKPISIIASNHQFKEFFGPYFELWHKMRIERGIRQRSIFPLKFEGKLEKRKLLTYKFVDDRYSNPTTTVIFGDNCLLIQWSNEPVAVKIFNKEITRSHLNYFNMIYKK